MPAPKQYDLEDWYRVAMWFVVLGSIKRAARKAGIPHGTVYKWAKTLEWDQIVEDVRKKFTARIDAGFQRIITKGQQELIERLTKGDLVVAKDGALVRKPVSARDIATIIGISTDKRIGLGQMSKAPEKRGGRLADLAKSLTDKTSEADRNRVEPLNAEPLPPVEKVH